MLNLLMIFPKELFVVYRVLSVVIRTFIKVKSMFNSKLKLVNIKTKLLFYFSFHHQTEACLYQQGDAKGEWQFIFRYFYYVK